jgi:hypothetical protein
LVITNSTWKLTQKDQKGKNLLLHHWYKLSRKDFRFLILFLSVGRHYFTCCLFASQKIPCQKEFISSHNCMFPISIPNLRLLLF